MFQNIEHYEQKPKNKRLTKENEIVNTCLFIGFSVNSSLMNYKQCKIFTKSKGVKCLY